MVIHKIEAKTQTSRIMLHFDVGRVSSVDAFQSEEKEHLDDEPIREIALALSQDPHESSGSLSYSCLPTSRVSAEVMRERYHAQQMGQRLGYHHGPNGTSKEWYDPWNQRWMTNSPRLWATSAVHILYTKAATTSSVLTLRQPAAE